MIRKRHERKEGKQKENRMTRISGYKTVYFLQVTRNGKTGAEKEREKGRKKEEKERKF